MRLAEIQKNVHVSKDKRNDFGGYNYRTAEGILFAAKAQLKDGEAIVVSDRMQEIAGQIFVTSRASLVIDGAEAAFAEASAMHPLTKKGMDPSQITGAASSYARKYALSGLLAIDDSEHDPDAAKTSYEPDPPKRDAIEIRDSLLTSLNKHGSVAATTQKFKDAHNWLIENDAPKGGEVTKAITDTQSKEAA